MLAMEQGASQLLLQKLDRAGERWLRYVALLGRSSEVQLVCHGEEITDLIHLHCSTYGLVGQRTTRIFTLG